MTGDVLVVGGGVAGLVAGYDLAIAGHRVTVVEASQRVGGTVSSYEIDGLKVDVGAESFATATGVVQRLIDDLGLAAEVVQPRTGAAWIQHLSGAAPLPAGGWLGIPARPWASDVRRVIGWPGSVRALADLGLPFNVGRSSGSIGGLVSARLGQRVLNRLVEPVVGGVYSTAPADLAFQRLPVAAREALREERSLAKVAASVRSGAAAAGSQVAGLRGGMSRLVDALVDGIQQHGGSLVTGVAVSALRREDGRWRVSAQSHTWAVDAVVLATPADATLALLGEPAPLAPVNSVLLCTIVVNQPELASAPRGSGLLVAAGVPQIAAKALTHATAKWAWLGEAAGPGRHVLRLSYGRIGDRTLPDHAAFPRLAVADAARLLGVPIRREQLSGWTVNRWPVTGAAAAVPPAAPDGIAITGGWVAGTGLAAVVGHSRTQTAQVLNHLAGRSVLAGPLPH